MKRNNTAIRKKYTTFAILAMLLLVLTSCPIKNAVKSYFDVPVTGQAAGKKLLTFQPRACIQANTIDDISISLQQLIAKNIFTPLYLLVFFSALTALLFIFTFIHSYSDSYHGLFPPIPIFLRNRQLLIWSFPI